MPTNRRFPASQLSAAAIVCLFAATSIPALDNGLGRTPPMGWNPWNKFLTRVNENIVKEMADSIKSKGLQDLGYTYICVDGGGSFPSGKKALADHLHAEGFKYGAYANDDRGLPNVTTLATTLYNDGADYLKFDCYHTPMTDPVWVAMRDAILAKGRPIFYNIHASSSLTGLSAAGKDSLKLIANMWRVSSDINIDLRSVFWNADCSNMLWSLAGPSHWNDPDMLEVGVGDSLGVGGYSLEENRTHFGLWCIMAAPLLLGNDFRYSSEKTLSVISNPEVIAIDQDTLGIQGRKLWSNGPGGLIGQDIWVKPLCDGNKAFIVLNRGATVAPRTVVRFDTMLGAPGAYLLRDLWERRDIGVFADSFEVTNLASRASVLVKATKTDMAPVSRVVKQTARRAGMVRGAVAVSTDGRWYSRMGVPLTPQGRIAPRSRPSTPAGVLVDLRQPPR